MTYQQAWNELMSYVPKLSPPIAQKLVQRAWRDIRDSRLWSFLVGETVIAVPVQISTGTVTTTNGLATVLGDSTATTAWSAISNAELVTRQFRSGAGPIYNIIDYTFPLLTLDREYSETSVTGAAYSIYKCYYPPPADFSRWTSVVDPINGYQFGLDRTKAQLDHTDPLRGAIGQPLVIASYKYDTDDPAQWLYELYPHPVVQQSYPALYQKKGVDFSSPTSTFNAMIPDSVVEARSRWRAYEWAMANSAAHPELRGVNWAQLRGMVDEEYQKDLARAQLKDEDIFSQNFIEMYTHSRWSRIAYDGSYAYNHAPLIGWYM
jgi:hypothetical protein